MSYTEFLRLYYNQVVPSYTAEEIGVEAPGSSGHTGCT